ncbi:MAG: PASTA domain-containing protein [Ferruginibacter sp.]
MFKFITDRPFWVNLLAAILLAFLIGYLVLQLLGVITKHGEYLVVPAVIGKSTAASTKLLEDKGFEVVIQDSVYTEKATPGTILKQLPDANATVKINRTVYLTVNCYIPPMIAMPQLEGKSFTFAMDLLQRSHLKLGDTTYKPDFMKGSILEQLHNGVKIPEGTKVRWGSKISLVIAGGLNSEQMLVPDMVGLTFGEAKTLLEADGINLGAVIVDAGVKDTAAAFVYKQNPPRFTEEKRSLYIRSGQLMDLYLSAVMINTRDSTDSNTKKTETP